MIIIIIMAGTQSRLMFCCSKNETTKKADKVLPWKIAFCLSFIKKFPPNWFEANTIVFRCTIPRRMQFTMIDGIGLAS